MTVVEDEWWCASVTERGSGIAGDWRLKQSNVLFSEFALPQAVGVRCVELTRRLGLSFSAIDLALSDDRFFFLEVNPTGEWAWLQEEAQFPIAQQTRPSYSDGAARDDVGDPDVGHRLGCFNTSFSMVPRTLEPRSTCPRRSRILRASYDEECNEIAEFAQRVDGDAIRRHLDSAAQRLKSIEDKARANLLGITIGIAVLFSVFDLFAGGELAAAVPEWLPILLPVSLCRVGLLPGLWEA